MHHHRSAPLTPSSTKPFKTSSAKQSSLPDVDTFVQTPDRQDG
jgi:hypothetical protein